MVSSLCFMAFFLVFLFLDLCQDFAGFVMIRVNTVEVLCGGQRFDDNPLVFSVDEDISRGVYAAFLTETVRDSHLPLLRNAYEIWIMYASSHLSLSIRRSTQDTAF
jgi:hypothetical protein